LESAGRPLRKHEDSRACDSDGRGDETLCAEVDDTVLAHLVSGVGPRVDRVSGTGLSHPWFPYPDHP